MRSQPSPPNQNEHPFFSLALTMALHNPRDKIQQQLLPCHEPVENNNNKYIKSGIFKYIYIKLYPIGFSVHLVASGL